MRSTCYAILFVVLLSGVGCVGVPPIDDFSLARTALESAKRSGSPRFAPGFWSRAEESYRRAKSYFSDRYYDKAKAEFRRARAFAEKAENATRLKKFKSGEDFS